MVLHILDSGVIYIVIYDFIKSILYTG